VKADTLPPTMSGAIRVSYVNHTPKFISIRLPSSLLLRTVYQTKRRPVRSKKNKN
jgi:hypothetical protein